MRPFSLGDGHFAPRAVGSGERVEGAGDGVVPVDDGLLGVERPHEREVRVGRAGRLRARKVANIERMKPRLIAAGNIGCMTQIGSATPLPLIHTIELLDWADGGPLPQDLTDRGFSDSDLR